MRAARRHQDASGNERIGGSDRTADPTHRLKRGVEAYARIFDVPEKDVPAAMAGRVGPVYAEEVFLAVGGHERHHRCRPLAIDGRQFLGEVLAPQLDLLIGVLGTAHSSRRQRTGDLLDVVPLHGGKRQRHIPPPRRPGTRPCAAVRSRHDIKSSTDRAGELPFHTQRDRLEIDRFSTGVLPSSPRKESKTVRGLLMTQLTYGGFG